MGPILQIARGAALGGLLAGAVWAIVLFVGLAPGANRVFLVVLALSGIGYYVIPPGDRMLAATGAATVGVFGLSVGLVTGFGWLEGALTLGGSVASGWLLLGIELKTPREQTVVVLSFVAIGLIVLALVSLVIDGETLGHDEAAYALKARAWLDGTPDSGWTIHRGPALSGYLYLVLAAGGDEPAMRAIGLVSLVALSGATWWLGNRMFTRTVGAISAVLVLAGPAILRRATEALTDIPAAALLVACMAIIWSDFERREAGPSFRLLWVLPFAWLAFYLRYQSVLAFGLIGLTMLILWWPRIRARPAPVVVSASIGLLGMIPHAIYSISEMGSPIGILQATGSVAGRAYVGEGIVDYVLLLGWPLAGLMGLPLVVFFVWWILRSWGESTTQRKALFLGIPAIGQVVALGIVSHGEARFVFFPLALVAIGSVAGVIGITESWSDGWRRGVRVALAALLISSIGISVANTRRLVEERAISYEPIELAAEQVDEMAGPDCAVMTTFLPQVTFYSECFTDRFRVELSPEEAIGHLEGEDRFMILIEDGRRQPEGDDLGDLIQETAGQPVVLDTGGHSAMIYEFEE